MAINYERVAWTGSKALNPSRLNQMDLGTKNACDGVDRIENRLSVQPYDTQTTSWQDAMIALHQRLADFQGVSERILYKPASASTNSAIFVTGIKTSNSGRYIVFFTNSLLYVVFDSDSHFTSRQITMGGETAYPS